MVEVSLKSYDPLAYHVNDVSSFDRNLVKAYKSTDKTDLSILLAEAADKTDYDVLICVNKSMHAFVLLIAVAKITPNTSYSFPELSPDFTDVPALQLVPQIESERMYKIRMKLDFFRNVQSRIHTTYYIGRYKNISAFAYQCAALDASPTRYSVFLDDCVEFSKQFCLHLLSYTSNKQNLRENVENAIDLATASVFSVEKLSRNAKSSARSMNTFFGGMDVTTFIGTKWVIILWIMFLLLYPVLVYKYMTS